MKKGSYSHSTQGMQDLGIHYMGLGIKGEALSPEELERMKKEEEKKNLEYVANLMAADKDCKPFENKKLYPTNNRIIVLPYDKNPYRVPLHQSTSGLILGDGLIPDTFKSPDSGEEEARQRGIWCCKVIAAGPECKNVEEEEDVYINFTMAAPVPFGGKGYYTISENNVICSVRNK